MGHEVRYLCQVEARRLVLLIGMVFAVVLVMRYIELPYGSVTTSIFSTTRPHVSGIGTFPTGDSFPNPEVLDNRTSSNHLNSTDTYVG